MHLLKDLYTIYGELLVKKDVEIKPIVVKKVRQRGARHKQAIVSLGHTDVFTDFKKVFNDRRYINMLQSPSVKKDVCSVAGSLKIEHDLLFELSAMKSNLPYTYNHVLIVAAFAIRLSQIYKPAGYNKHTVAHCGFTHDIGKTRVPVSILEKSTKLTKVEKTMIDTHPVMGYLMLNYYLKKDRTICSLASLDHHERKDGSGYPNGIKRIDKYTQLTSVVDVMDALMTRRPYRKKMFSLRAALDYLMKEALANKFDKDIVLTLISLARKDKPNIRSMKVSKEVREELPEELKHDKYA
ncbi:MAG: HD domain-containing phosphohydrolase [Candidatus Omnitrophota bacterium]